VRAEDGAPALDGLLSGKENGSCFARMPTHRDETAMYGAPGIRRTRHRHPAPGTRQKNGGLSSVCDPTLRDETARMGHPAPGKKIVACRVFAIPPFAMKLRRMGHPGPGTGTGTRHRQKMVACRVFAIPPFAMKLRRMGHPGPGTQHRQKNSGLSSGWDPTLRDETAKDGAPGRF
jgi:hypothetical protein